MAHHVRSIHSLGLALLLSGAVVTNVACSSDDNPADGGVADSGGGFHADASEFDSGIADAGVRDSGPARDATVPPDAGFNCTSNESVTVTGQAVQVGQTSMASGTQAGRADLSCSHPDPGAFSDPMFIRGCLNVLGAAPTEAELQQLEFAVFETKNGDGSAADPSFDPATWADRTPGARVAASVEFDPTVAEAVCPSRVQVQIGFNAPVGNALLSEHEYTLRVRTATSATSVWATMYFPNYIARNDDITKIGVNDCTSQNCYNRYNFTVMRTSTLAGFAAQAPSTVPGSADLTDGRGAGYAMIELFDCNVRAMSSAVAGVRPSPLSDGYLTGSTLDLAATESSDSGLYLALGFNGQTAANTDVLAARVAVGANSLGVCTEEFAGEPTQIYPDAITVYRSGRDSVLHGR